MSNITGKAVSQEQNFTEEALKRLILDSAPERVSEFNQLWEESDIEIQSSTDRPGFSLRAGPYGLVLFNHRTLCQIWLLGFAAQKASYTYSLALVQYQLQGTPFSKELLRHDAEFPNLISECNRLLSDILILNGVESFEDFHWPDDIPRPAEGKPSDLDGSLVLDLLCMAGAYFFLHELRHVLLQNENANLNEHDEEMECDRYAREFLLSNIEEYSEQSDYDIDKLKTKRAMSIALASLLLLVITPRDRWIDSPLHPSVIERIKVLADYLELPENDNFWVYLSSLLLAQIEQHDINLESQLIRSQKSYCYELLKMLDKSSDN